VDAMMFEEIGNMNYIYVVFIVTNTNMGKLIRLFTRNQYSHVTVAFDKDLRQMYSFARYHINSPISGGFVIEQPERYLNGNNDVTVKICELPVTEEEYNRIHTEVAFFKQNKEEMIYNTMNAVLSLLRRRISVKNTFTCLEFVTYLLHYSNILAIKELERRLEKFVVYHGSLKGIAQWEQSFVDEDDYFRRRHVMGIVTDTVYHFRKIVARMIQA
jgi:hypothetical protein